MESLLKEFQLTEAWIDRFRNKITVTMRCDVSTHGQFDLEFVKFDGPKIVADLVNSSDKSEEKFGCILLNSIIPYHCPKSNQAICSDGRTVNKLISLLFIDKMLTIGWGLRWGFRSTVINNFAFFAKYEENHPYLNTAELKNIMVAETKLSEKSVATISATIFLANLVGNRENKDDESLISNEENLRNLTFALASGEWLNWIWPPRTMAPALRRLALNENNKNILREVGIFDILLSILSDSHFLEDAITVTEVLKLIVNLAFNDENKIIMKSMEFDSLFRTLLYDNRESLESPHIKIIQEILWILNPPINSISTMNRINSSIDNNPLTAQLPSNLTSNRQVMISYNWAAQDLAKTMNEFLRRNGLKVWIDIESMEGSTLEAMANAIESSDIILIFVSRKYKESANCRIEGEYAFQQRKEMIPIIAEAGYKADGWLGALLGSRLWYDFSDPEKFQSTSHELLKVLHKKLNVSMAITETSTVGIRPSFADNLRAEVSRSHPESWTVEQVVKWVDEIQFVHDSYGSSSKGSSRVDYKDIFADSYMTGGAMVQLALFSRRDPKYYVELLHELGFPTSRLGVMLEFTRHLERTFLAES